MNKKLIIWDFDGVIADTEKLWLKNWMNLINEKFQANWDIKKTISILAGMSEKTKRQIINGMGMDADDIFMKEVKFRNLQEMVRGFALTPEIDDIFKINDFEQCIATGSDFEKTKIKIDTVDIKKYFPLNKVFTADMVAHGKPAPDLHLLAAAKMGYKPEDCIVIEDSIAGMTAGIRAGMNVIAFLQHNLYEDDMIEVRVKELGISNVFYNMKDVKEFLLKKHT